MPKWKVYRGQIIIAAMIARSSLFAYRFTAVRILNSTTWHANGPPACIVPGIGSIVQYIVACAVLVTVGRRCFLIHIDTCMYRCHFSGNESPGSTKQSIQ
jgi:hypothetical protein